MRPTFTIISTVALLAVGSASFPALSADVGAADVKLRLVQTVPPADPPSVDQQPDADSDADTGSGDEDRESGDSEENMGHSNVPEPTPQPPGCIFDNKPLELLV